MKHLQILNLSLAALAATFAGVLAVVCVLYAFNLETAPRLRDELPRLFAVTTLFGLVALYCGTVWWAHRSGKSWAWWSQAAMLPVGALASLMFLDVTGLR